MKGGFEEEDRGKLSSQTRTFPEGRCQLRHLNYEVKVRGEDFLQYCQSRAGPSSQNAEGFTYAYYSLMEAKIPEGD